MQASVTDTGSNKLITLTLTREQYVCVMVGMEDRIDKLRRFVAETDDDAERQRWQERLDTALATYKLVMSC